MLKRLSLTPVLARALSSQCEAAHPGWLARAPICAVPNGPNRVAARFTFNAAFQAHLADRSVLPCSLSEAFPPQLQHEDNT